MRNLLISSRASRSWSRRGVVLGAACATALSVALLIPSLASANLTGSNFEGNDGNLAVNTAGNADWANVAGLNKGIDQPSGSNDNSFGQGTKEDNAAVTVVSGSIPPNKNDLSRFYEASALGANGHTYLYLAWERLVNIGNANLDFEINQRTTAGFGGTFTGPITLTRTAGDLLVTYDFSGSGTPTLGLNTWLTAAAGNTTSQCFSANALPCWGRHINLGGAAEGAVNTVTVSDPIAPSAPRSLTAGLFGEASIDLTAAGVFPAGTCEAFGSAFLKSRSSSSFTAEIKDFIAPTAVNINNCGTITVHKVTENGDSSFGYATTGGLSPSTFSLANGGTQTYTAVPAGNSSITENLTAAQTTAGWTLKSLACTATGTGTSASPSGAAANIVMGAGGSVDCTYTNHINLSPTIATELSKTTANIGDSITDSSSLTGATANAGGTVTYHAYAGANTCTGTDLLNSTVTVTNGIVPDSGAFTPASAGTYSFQAVYSGDSNNNGASSPCSSEQLLVKNNPSIGTILSAASVDVGSSVHDTASLTGASSNAGGTVTYTVYTNNTCTTGARAAGTVTVTNGIVPDSNALAFTSAGTFYWQAVYSGDANNNGATSTCTDETLVVNPLQPGVSTAQNLIPNDTFSLSGATSTAGGTITMRLYAPGAATCTETPALTQTVNVSGNGDYSTTNTAFRASTEGTWRWESTYGGDNNNLAVTSSCGTERFTIANS
jgi:hypothetical protein